MTYKELIDNIIANRGRVGCGDMYHEKHHIIPRCCNGDNSQDNLVDLYAEEHYMAHKLLALENPDNEKLQFAWWQMCHCKKDGREYEVSAEDYAAARESHALAIAKQSTLLWVNPDSRAKIEAILSSTETRKKMSDSAKRRYETPEGRAHIEGMWTDKRKIRISKPVIQYTKDGQFIAEYFGAHEASRCTGVVCSSIIECCGGKRRSAGGFIWEHKK